MTNPDGHSPATLAELDQGQAILRAHVLRGARTARLLIEKRGEVQGVCDMTSMHIADRELTRPTLCALLATAAFELAKAGIRPDWAVSDVD